MFGFGTASGQGLNGAPVDQFGDPFQDYASLHMPETMQLALRWCEYVLMCQGTYREAVRRLLSYFISDIEVYDGNAEDQEKWKKFFEDTLGIKRVLHNVGLDLMCYGNSFTSVIPITNRYVLCDGCKTVEKPLASVIDDPSFEWRDYRYWLRCPKCGWFGSWKFYDRPDGRQDAFTIKRWSPHEIEILNDKWSEECRYVWKIPEEYRRQVREGKNRLVIQHVPPEVISAIKNDNNIIFDKDFIFHMREDTLAGINSRGWGVSRVLTNFRQAWYVQFVHRYNEAIVLDYMIPFRVITPAPGDKSIGADPMLGLNLGGYMGQIQAMIRRRRRDPAAWHTLPFPIQYQALGGDASRLAPREILDQGLDELLGNIGIPAELYRANLAIQAAPAALRLFEAANASIQDSLNEFLNFVVRKTSSILKWNPVKVRLARVTHADDLQRQAIKLNLASSGMASMTNAMRSVGMDFKEEVRQMMDEQKFQAEQQAKLQEEMERAFKMKEIMQAPMAQPGNPQAGLPGQPAQAAAGAPAAQAPAAPGAGPLPSVVDSLPRGPNVAVSPEELMTRASYIVESLTSMPESQKDSELIKLKKIDPVLHATVTAQLRDRKQQMRTQGAIMLAQQMGKMSQDRKSLLEGL